ncbi:MAG: pyridoxamine 5'-phosphate oxidase family protein [Nitrososphaerales archaeon]
MSKPDGKEAIPREVLTLLQDSKIGYLSVTSPKGELYSYPVAFHFGEGKIFLITPAGSAKMKFMKANPNVSFIVDNRRLTLEACGVMIQGRAKVFSIAGLVTSIMSMGPKVQSFTKKYPGLFGFYAKGKDLPPERKIYKYRFVRIDPSKFVYWTGYKYGKHVPARSRKEATAEMAIDLKDESNVGAIAGLLGSADDEPEIDKLPLNEDWLGELEAAAASGVITPEEGKAIGSATVGLQDLGRPAAPGKVTEGEKKLLRKWKSGTG